MKSAPYLAALTLLILSGCSSAYKTTQTPDDVYYSPRVQRTYASENNNQKNDNVSSTDANDQGDDTYVTYDDEDQGDYSRRISRFNNSGYSGSYYNDGFYGSPGIYSGMYGSPFYSSFGYGGGFGYPYYSSFYGPSLSIGLGFGYGYGYNSWYNPWSPWGYNYYSPIYYGGYYGGGYYGGGYYGHGGNYYAPVRGRRSRDAFGSGGRVVGNNGGYTPGGRVGRTDYRPSRTTTNTGNSGGRTGNSNGSYQPRRVFNQSAGERSTTVGGRTSDNAPTRSYQPQSQPSRSYQPSQPSYTPSRSSGGNSGGSFGGSGGGGSRSGGRTRN